jgi:hypothetical protein
MLKRTRPYTTGTNSKAGRVINTLLAEWTYSMPFKASGERDRWLPRYLAICNGRRCQMAMVGRTPIRQFEVDWFFWTGPIVNL